MYGPGDRVLLDDGRIRLSVLETRDGEVVTRVEDGGPLGEHKGINLPGVDVSAPAITDKDRADLAFGLHELGVDYVALSFIRTADEVREAQALAQQPRVGACRSSSSSRKARPSTTWRPSCRSPTA